MKIMIQKKWGLFWLVLITLVSVGYPVCAEETNQLTGFANKVWVNYEKGYTIREEVELRKSLDDAIKDPDLIYRHVVRRFKRESMSENQSMGDLLWSVRSYRYGTAFLVDLSTNYRSDFYSDYYSGLRARLSQPLFNGITMAMNLDQIEKLDYKIDDLIVIQSENLILTNAVDEYLEYNYLLFKSASINATIHYLEDLLAKLENKDQPNAVYLKLSLKKAQIRLIQTERLLLDQKVKLAELAGEKNQQFELGFDNYIAQKDSYFDKLHNAYDEYDRLALENQKLEIEIQKLMVDYYKKDNGNRLSLETEVQFEQDGDSLGKSLEFDDPVYYLGVSWEYNILAREDDWRLKMAQKELADLERDNLLLKQNANDKSFYGKESLLKLKKEVGFLEDEQSLLKEKLALETEAVKGKGNSYLKDVTETIETLEENQEKYYQLIIDAIKEYYHTASSNLELKNLLVNQ